MKYEITYRCGHTGTIELFGKCSEREWRLKGASAGNCPECTNAEREAAAAKAASESKAAGLPDLQGSERQVIWALQLRQAFINRVEETREMADANYRKYLASYPEKKDELDALLVKDRGIIDRGSEYILSSYTRASWWIDTRSDNILKILQEAANSLPDPNQTTSGNVADDNAAKADATVTPEPCAHPGAVEVAVKADRVVARYARDEEFRRIVKDSLGYKWDTDARVWYKAISYHTGTAEDRAAELGNALLRAGFSVTIYDEGLRRRAVDAEFEPECKRWVSCRQSGKYAGWLAINWPRGGQNFYNAAHRIHGARWDSPNMVVPIESYAEALDFADCNGFQISPGAKKAIDAYEVAKNPPVLPADPPEPPALEDKLGQILQSSAEILPDLRDEE